MRKLLTICVFTLLTTLLTAQVSISVNVITAGTLTTLLSATEKTTVTNLTILGNIDARDVKCMRDELTSLANLDLSAVSIQGYSGEDATDIYRTFYLSNSMPRYSFYCDNNGLLIYSQRLKKILLPNSLTDIGESAFYLSGLSGTLIIPNNVSTIGNSAFSSCSELNGDLIIGSGVTYIDNYAFSGCSGIKTIYSLNSNPPTLGSNCFQNVSSLTAIYVQATAVNAYKTAPGWSSFSSLIYAGDLAVTYSISLQISTGGTVKENNVSIGDGSQITVTPASTKTFTFTPLDGYEIATLTYNGVDVKSQLTNNQYTTPAVSANATLSVTFQKIQYRVSLKDASTGTMNLLCYYGETPSFDFTPMTGWRVNTVFYNSTDVTSSLINGIYKVPSITANVLLNVSFVSIATGAPQLTNDRVKVYCMNSEIIIDGTSEGEFVTLYTINGKQIQSIISKGEKLNLPVDRDAVYFVKTGEKTFKVIL